MPKSSKRSQALNSSPWPQVEVRGELDRAENEWLHTNGAGAYAMSTVALMHTRRHHGLLVAALKPPLERYVILSHAETELEVKGRRFRLAAHRFPGMDPMPGYRHLMSFQQAPLPTWRYRFGNIVLERSLALVPGQNSLIISYTLQGASSAKLIVRPLLPLRPMHEIAHEYQGMVQSVALRPHQVQIQPVPNLPPICFEHRGLFLGSPDWWRRFKYLADDPENNTEDLWTPGTFEIPIQNEETQYLTVALEELPTSSPEELFNSTRDYWLNIDPGDERVRQVRSLSVAAEQFCADKCSQPSIISGYPWFGVWTRDTCIALPGLLLTRGKVDSAKAILGTLLDAQIDGVLPRRLAADAEGSKNFPSRRPIPAGYGRSEFSSIDATLWLFEAARHLIQWTGCEDTFVEERLYPALKAAYGAICEGREELGFGLTTEGLIKYESKAKGASVAGPARSEWSKRLALPVELQALWTSGLSVLEQLARAYGDLVLERATKNQAELTKASFKRLFWCEAQRYPYDSLPLDDLSQGDPRIRPYALIALAIDPSLFETWQASSIIEQVQAHLLNPRGIRSLTPYSKDYLGHFEGSYEERETAYHRGAARTYLLQFYARAIIHLKPEDFEVRAELRSLVDQIIDAESPLLGQISQLANGDPPYSAAGALAQATSVAALLWILCGELDL